MLASPLLPPGQCELVIAPRVLLVRGAVLSFPPLPASWQGLSLGRGEPWFSQRLGWIGAASPCSSPQLCFCGRASGPCRGSLAAGDICSSCAGGSCPTVLWDGGWSLCSGTVC